MVNRVGDFTIDGFGLSLGKLIGIFLFRIVVCDDDAMLRGERQCILLVDCPIAVEENIISLESSIAIENCGKCR